jgi:hypothetical protein
LTTFIDHRHGKNARRAKAERRISPPPYRRPTTSFLRRASRDGRDLSDGVTHPNVT